MAIVKDFLYKPDDYESEKASNSYLMSLIAFMVGLPIPIVNLAATFMFYLGTRNTQYFVRWHSMQALLSQLIVFPLNSYGFWWTLSILFYEKDFSNQYIAYMICLFLLNATEFIFTIYTAMKTRKGIHVEWWIVGPIANEIVKN